MKYFTLRAALQQGSPYVFYDMARPFYTFAIHHLTIRMKYRFLSVTLLCAAALFSQCKQTRYTADNLPDEYLRFGNGGGFTGVETAYTLLENGQLFKTVSKSPETLEITGCDRKSAKKLFEKAEALGLEKLDFMYPGNMYGFIEILDDGKTNRIAWGDREHPADENIMNLYSQLMELAAQKK
ncbi:MAG: hypothetical protein EP344_06115 [Bacteroidetes bacterium]|nr:MAG: hypothetical protein EP344_06115 [Bacteroidota bacterium]